MSFMHFLKQMQSQYLSEARLSGLVRKVALAPGRSPYLCTNMSLKWQSWKRTASGLHGTTTRTGEDYLASSASVIPSCTSHLWQPVNAASLQLSCPLVLQRLAELHAAAAAGTGPVLHHAFVSPHPDCKQQKLIVILLLKCENDSCEGFGDKHER